jgi:hypothetical protein
MKPSSSYIPSTNVAVLVAGDPGSGKTRLAMSFPKPGILDCDGNLSSAVRVSGNKPFLFSQPFKDDNGKEILEVDRWNRAMSESKLMLASSDTESFVLDGLSNLCRWGLVHAENELTKAGINVKKEYLAKYQAFIPLLTNYITMLRIPGKYVVVNVHQNMEKEELAGQIRYVLDIPGRLANNLGGFFTDVWGMTAQADPQSKIGAKYLVRTKPTGFHVTLKTSLDMEPTIDITGKTPPEIWTLLAPKLSVNQPQPTK